MVYVHFPLLESAISISSSSLSNDCTSASCQPKQENVNRYDIFPLYNLCHRLTSSLSIELKFGCTCTLTFFLYKDTVIYMSLFKLF